MSDPEQINIEALDKSIRVALSNGGNEPTEQIVKRAEAFKVFLLGK